MRCGVPSRGSGNFAEVEPHPSPGERQLMTVLFTDIVDSTRAAREVSDEAWRRRLNRFESHTALIVGRRRGTLVRSTGDGILATFDGPARAVETAVALRDDARCLDSQLRAGLRPLKPHPSAFPAAAQHRAATAPIGTSGAAAALFALAASEVQWCCQSTGSYRYASHHARPSDPAPTSPSTNA